MLSALMEDLKEQLYCLAKGRPPKNYKTVDKTVKSGSAVCVFSTSKQI